MFLNPVLDMCAINMCFTNILNIFFKKGIQSSGVKHLELNGNFVGDFRFHHLSHFYVFKVPIYIFQKHGEF